MEKIKEISRKYILDDPFDRMRDILEQFKQFVSGDPTGVMKKHFVEITEEQNEYFIEFDKIEKVQIEKTNILPYLEYVLNIYKTHAKRQNPTVISLVKIEPNYSYMQIQIDDIIITIKIEMVESIFESLKNSGIIDNYSVYSSEEKYQKIKKIDYSLSPDEFNFLFYKEFELPQIENTSNYQKVLKNNNK